MMSGSDSGGLPAVAQDFGAGDGSRQVGDEECRQRRDFGGSDHAADRAAAGRFRNPASGF